MTAGPEQDPGQTWLTHPFSFGGYLFSWRGKWWWLAPSASLQVQHLGQKHLFRQSCSPHLPPLLISTPSAALTTPAGQWLACCYFIPFPWVSTKAVKLRRNIFWAAKGLRSFALSLYPALLTNSWTWSNDLFQASGLWDTKILLFLTLPFSI